MGRREPTDMDYLDGWCDGVNEALSVCGKDMHLMVFHPDYDATEAGLDFLVDDGVTDENLSYCMVFVATIHPRRCRTKSGEVWVLQTLSNRCV